MEADDPPGQEFLDPAGTRRRLTAFLDSKTSFDSVVSARGWLDDAEMLLQQMHYELRVLSCDDGRRRGSASASEHERAAHAAMVAHANQYLAPLRTYVAG
eukprot:COSAG01_NODE_44955_length_414_cov_0.590476_1_plen_99_part_10